MNRLEITAEIEELEPVRYTPAGTPVRECRLRHTGEVEEGGFNRKLDYWIPAVAVAKAAEKLADAVPGTTIRATGFIAPRSYRTKQLVVHITDFVLGD